MRPAGTVRGYPFVECAACAFTFTPRVTAESMAALYAGGYHGASEGAPEVGWANTDFLQPALQRLGRAAPFTMLDFGTGESVVPDVLRAAGHRVIAIDIVPPRRPHPDRLTTSLEASGFEARSFDLVFAFQVFEHLPQPRPVLDRLLQLVRPGGLLLIHTDMETPERAAGLAQWWYVQPPDHCCFYRPATFAHCLAGSAYRVCWRDAKSVLIRRYDLPKEEREMAQNDAKQKLVDFLDRRAFDPVLKAKPDDYPENKRRKLEDVQRATRSERERFHGYESAEKVYQMYEDDLSSDEAKEVHRELRDLGLPTIADVRGDFESMAKQLGVHR